MRQIIFQLASFALVLSHLCLASAENAKALKNGREKSVTADKSGKAIYGSDSRKDYYDLSSSWKKIADSTVALVLRYKVNKSSGSEVSLSTIISQFINIPTLGRVS